ncbi:MAG TPA: bifunctional metallophosphatase/5'-nucleotidase [Myxococcaceae bacterium]|nr:bifunctional metallophosphatase/5'-nucleotidase [Myxococcaceae bacterium]
MHRLFLLLALAACAGSPPPPHAATAPVHVQLLAFNDFHGHLEPPPGNVRLPDGTVPAGGGAWLAAHVARLRAEEPDTLVVAAGDLIGASPLPSALSHDEPTLALMDTLGLDVSSVGNHEFDEGADELLRLQRGGCRTDEPTCKPPGFSGARFTYLAANVFDRAGKTLLPATVVKKVGGATLGFVGVVLRETATVVTPSGVAGLTFGDEADAVNAAVPRLREAGADAIVVLIHQGGAQAPGSAPGDCRGFSGPLVDLAQRFRGVDVIVSGHLHQAYVCPDLGGALVTSAGSFGRFLTRIELDLDPVQHRVLSRKASQVAVTHDLAPDARAKAIVDRAIANAAPLANRRVGRLAAGLSRSPNEAGESTLGDVVADAHLAATRKAGAVIAFTNPGGLRADLQGGDVTYAQTFAAQPFGNLLVTFTLTGAQLGAMLEQQWLGSRPRILQPSANVTYAWSAAASAGAKVVPGSLKVDGRALGPDARVRVTVNGFLGAGGDGFSVFTEGTERTGGPPDLEALVTYLRPTLDGTPLPKPSGPRITRVP